MADKLIGADALTRAIVNSPSDISGYNPVYCNVVPKSFGEWKKAGET